MVVYDLLHIYSNKYEENQIRVSFQWLGLSFKQICYFFQSTDFDRMDEEYNEDVHDDQDNFGVDEADEVDYSREDVRNFAPISKLWK